MLFVLFGIFSVAAEIDTCMNNYHKYFHITPREEKWGIYVNTAGYSRINPNANYPNNNEHPLSHSFNWNKGLILSEYYLIFISRGQGVFESAITEPLEINEGSCFFLYPGVWHRYKPNASFGWEEYWMGFNGTYPHELMHKDFFSPEQPLVEVGLYCDLLSLFQNLIETIHNYPIGYHQVLAGMALQILGIVNAESMCKAQENDPMGRLINKAKFLLQESLDKPADIELLANDLHIGYSTFRKNFKKKLGVSPNQYHLNLRLNRAMHLLTSSSLTISKIAYQTGFESLFYFSKLFKKKPASRPGYIEQATTDFIYIKTFRKFYRD